MAILHVAVNSHLTSEWRRSFGRWAAASDRKKSETEIDVHQIYSYHRVVCFTSVVLRRRQFASPPQVHSAFDGHARRGDFGRRQRQDQGSEKSIFDEIKRVEDLTSFHNPSELTRINEAAGKGPVKTMGSC